MIGGIIGIPLGIVMIVGIQIFCYTFFDEDNNTNTAQYVIDKSEIDQCKIWLKSLKGE